MIRIGVMGGSFNPVHRGHIQLAKHGLLVCDAVLMVPCCISRYGKVLCEYKHRLNMCVIACTDFGLSIMASSAENWGAANGKTYTLLKELKKLYSKQLSTEFELLCIVGEDAANEVDGWYKSDNLKDEFSFIVIGRPDGNTYNDKWYHTSTHIYIPGMIKTNFNSTEIRQILKKEKNEKINEHINPQVFNYINENGLYE